jgi:rfaE bifunctional protein nucleotidyltransferase chain/domain
MAVQQIPSLLGERLPLPPLFVEALAAALPRPMVFTNGVFDQLHAGHVDCLEQARALGVSLVVGINSDASARRLGKGPGRPLNKQADRLSVVQALAAVSAAVLFDEDAPLSLLRTLRPEVYVKRGDHRLDPLPEAPLIASWGGRTVILPLRAGLSTTALVARAPRTVGFADAAASRPR